MPLFSRRDLIRIAYEAIGVEGQYIIGTEAGPLVTAYWVGTRYVHSFLVPLHATCVEQGGVYSIYYRVLYSLPEGGLEV